MTVALVQHNGTVSFTLPAHIAAVNVWRPGRGLGVVGPTRYRRSVETPSQTDVFRAMTPADKLRAAAALYRSARELKLAALRAQHPTWSEEQLARAVREIFLLHHG